MPRVKTTPPPVSNQKGERNLDLPLYLDRHVPLWRNPQWIEAETWRAVVAQQPFAVVCRDTLVANILNLDHKIEPKDSTKRDEYKKEIDYYTDFFDNTGDYDYADIIEWTGKDVLDLPFGSAVEVGREGDEPDGRVLWIELLDGGTLYPYPNSDWPVYQSLKEVQTTAVWFPYYAIDRIYMSPRPEIRRKGWGCAPPERIYLALSLIGRGDVYYADMLLDTPQVGILDLIDMEKTSAEEWVKSWRDMLTGIDPFKIPVLYEHEKAATFIPFQRSPTELLFDKTILKYCAIVAGGYGMALSDVGIQTVSSGGETLAGSIRQERRTRKTGYATLKRKYELFFNRMLPKYLQWKWIDLDDEVSVALGRARLATATALQILVMNKIMTPNEARQQMIADGLITISIPESVKDGDEFPESSGISQERPSLLGKPIAPSQGGYGETKSKAQLVHELAKEVANTLDNTTNLDNNLIRDIMEDE